MAAPWQCHWVCGCAFAVLGPFKPLDEALNGFTPTHLKVVYAERTLIHAQLHSTNVIKLIYMDFTFQSKGICPFEKRAGFFRSEVAFLAERVHVVNEALVRESGQHICDDVLCVGRRVFEFRRHGVAPEEGGFEGNGCGFFEAGDDAKHFALGVQRQSVSRLDLHGTHALGYGVVDTLQGIFKQFIFIHGLQGLGRIEDATATLGDFLVGRPFEPHQKLLAAAARKDRMGVAVAPRRKHPTPLGVDDVQAGPIDNAGKVVHISKVHDHSVFDGEPGVVENREFGHLRACHVAGHLVESTREAFDVLDKRSHDVQGIPSQGMAGNTFGTLFRLTTFGESHGHAMGGIVDGCPAGLALDLDAVQDELARRRPGQSSLTTSRKESDEVQWMSGMVEHDSAPVTTGAPLGFTIANTAARPGDYDHLKNTFRPSHADFTYEAKYGLRDVRGGGRASARETVSRVVAGAVARQILATLGVEVGAYVERVQDISMPLPPSFHSRDEVDAYPVRCPHPETAARMADRIADVKKAGDTVGGAIVLVARGVPAGWGEPVFDRLHADLAKAMWSLPATKSLELGSGLSGTLMRGSEHNDKFVDRGDRIGTATNRSGGIQGGISNGEDIVLRIGFKPVATVLQPGTSVDREGKPVELEGRGRHDPCVLPRAVPLVEAMACLVLVDHALRQRAARLTFGA